MDLTAVVNVDQLVGVLIVILGTVAVGGSLLRFFL